MRRSGSGNRVRPLGEILRALIGRKRFREKGRYSGLLTAWRQTVGEGVADQSRIRVFRDGKLVVEVDSPTLLHELNGFLKQELLTGLQATKAGRDVVELRLCLASGRRPPERIEPS